MFFCFHVDACPLRVGDFLFCVCAFFFYRVVSENGQHVLFTAALESAIFLTLGTLYILCTGFGGRGRGEGGRGHCCGRMGARLSSSFGRFVGHKR